MKRRRSLHILMVLFAALPLSACMKSNLWQNAAGKRTGTSGSTSFGSSGSGGSSSSSGGGGGSVSEDLQPQLSFKLSGDTVLVVREQTNPASETTHWTERLTIFGDGHCVMIRAGDNIPQPQTVGSAQLPLVTLNSLISAVNSVPKSLRLQARNASDQCIDEAPSNYVAYKSSTIKIPVYSIDACGRAAPPAVAADAVDTIRNIVDGLSSGTYGGSGAGSTWDD